MHPSRNTLKKYVTGELPEGAALLVDSHLNNCQQCEETLGEVEASAETGVEWLQEKMPVDRYASEPACVALLERIRRFAGSWTFQTGSDNTDTPPVPPALLETIRDYRLLRKLGQGGMGTVYSALHTKLDRPVALKLLPAHRMRQAGAVSRFAREMKAVGKLDHPHIVRATDAGEAGGVHYLVMELVRGEDLGQVATRLQRLPIPEACECIRQAAVGLQYASYRGMVHRDIKPSNLMLATVDEASDTDSASGNEALLPTVRIKILDMGLALFEDPLSARSDELTHSGQLMGTLDYMSPEQGTDTHSVDIRADIYSLGATLYRLLAGRAPFDEPRYDTPMKKLVALSTLAPVPIGELRPDLPQELASIVDRLLSRRREDRPATPAEVVQLLTPFTAGADLSRLLDTGAALPDASHITPSASPQELPVRVPPGDTTSSKSPRRIAPAVGVIAVLVGLMILPFPSRQENEKGTTAPTNGAASVIAWARSCGGVVGGGNSRIGYVNVQSDEPMPSGRFDLVTVDVSGVPMSSRDAPRFHELPHLTTLILNDTGIDDDSLAQLGDLPRLKGLFLNDSAVSDAGLRSLQRYPTLDTLHVSYSRVTDAGLTALETWSELKQLHLSGCQVTDAAIPVLARLARLEELEILATGFSRDGIERLRQILPDCRIVSDFDTLPTPDKTPASDPLLTPDRSVAEWVLSRGGIVGLGGTPAGYLVVRPGSQLPEEEMTLVTADLYECAVDDADLQRFDGLESLTTLILNSTPVTDEGLAMLGPLPNLRNLYLGDTGLTDVGLSALVKRFPRIRVLHAGGTKITEDGVSLLLKWPLLQDLHLENAQISDRCIPVLSRITHLRQLSLAASSVTQSGITRLRSAQPYCRITSNHGILGEPPIQGAASLRFNGIGDRVDLPTLRMPVSGPMTIEARVRKEPPFAAGAIILSSLRTVDGPPGVSLNWQQSTGWNLSLKGGDEPCVQSAAISEPNATPSYVAGVWDGGRLTLFLDGQLVSQCEAVAEGEDATPGHFVIGAERTADGKHHFYHFMGVIDELRISSSARYSAAYVPKPRLSSDADTVALYHFDEGEGSTLHDASGHGHHGTIVGATWVTGGP
ncbi:Serine/threonine-protein kinase PknH [Maioricimonas rarisocia]|uniref:Serine/threonine-protein kinase PknH n=1 Tax=Maioricimonas rarisocia TaxID=2528026 RepID=A0A517ZAT1_9PLAN|nr:protein kinase [Maioricimonas rarisocia]QDU39550.1 Serine/threonine-protein kinase PknH [Maioricimonas rarisocia]